MTTLRSQPIEAVSTGRSNADDPEATAHFPPPLLTPASVSTRAIAVDATLKSSSPPSSVHTAVKSKGFDYPVPAGFRALEIISQSSHGAVYKVLRSASQELCALKMIHCPDPRIAANLMEVLRKLTGINHKNLVGVREVFQLPQLVVCVMEWVGGHGTSVRSGSDLIQKLRASEGVQGGNVHGLASDRLWPLLGLDARLISPALVRAARPPTPYMSLIAAQFAGLARGLDLCHTIGIVHGDIKPANMFLRESGELALGDFGSATVTEITSDQGVGITSGTPKYLAPERWPMLTSGSLLSTLHTPDQRSDVWGLGVCLFEFLTLTSAFEAATNADMYRAIAALDVPSARTRNWMVPEGLDGVCRVSTLRNPHERYSTAGEMADALEAFSYAGMQARGSATHRAPGAWANRVAGWIRNRLSQWASSKGGRR